MLWHRVLVIILIAVLSVMFGYVLGGIMTTAKFADAQVRKDFEKEIDDND